MTDVLSGKVIQGRADILSDQTYDKLVNDDVSLVVAICAMSALTNRLLMEYIAQEGDPEEVKAQLIRSHVDTCENWVQHHWDKKYGKTFNW